jgi:peroxin-3
MSIDSRSPPSPQTSATNSPPLLQSPTISPRTDFANLPTNRQNAVTAVPSPPRPTKSRLWNDVKLQAITRAVTSIYVIPLVVLQTTSQLSIIARKQYLRELHAVRSSVEGPSSAGDTTDSDGSTRSKWYQPWSYFSVQGMGLAWVSDDTLTTSPIQSSSSAGHPADADVDRVFLCFSWWLLHVGWQIIEQKVANIVQERCGDLKLKQTMTLAGWQDLLKTIRTKLDEELVPASPQSDTPLATALLPPSTSSQLHDLLSRYPTIGGGCPLPSPPHAAALDALLNQMSAHFRSPDFDFLFVKLVDSLEEDLLLELSDEVYGGAMQGGAPGEAAIVPLAPEEPGRRLAACLPSIGRWSKDVWQGYPDKIVDSLLSSDDLVKFAALIFGDFEGGQESNAHGLS